MKRFLLVLLLGAMMLLLDAKATGGKHKRQSNTKTKRVVAKKTAGSRHRHKFRKDDLKDFNLDEDDDDDEDATRTPITPSSVPAVPEAKPEKSKLTTENEKQLHRKSKKSKKLKEKRGLDISNNPDAILAAGRLRYAIQESLGKLARAETDMHNALSNQATKSGRSLYTSIPLKETIDLAVNLIKTKDPNFHPVFDINNHPIYDVDGLLKHLNDQHFHRENIHAPAPPVAGSASPPTPFKGRTVYGAPTYHEPAISSTSSAPATSQVSVLAVSHMQHPGTPLQLTEKKPLHCPTPCSQQCAAVGCSPSCCLASMPGSSLSPAMDPSLLMLPCSDSRGCPPPRPMPPPPSPNPPRPPNPTTTPVQPFQQGGLVPMFPPCQSPETCGFNMAGSPFQNVYLQPSQVNLPPAPAGCYPPGCPPASHITEVPASIVNLPAPPPPPPPPPSPPLSSTPPPPPQPPPTPSPAAPPPPPPPPPPTTLVQLLPGCTLACNGHCTDGCEKRCCFQFPSDSLFGLPPKPASALQSFCPPVCTTGCLPVCPRVCCGPGGRKKRSYSLTLWRPYYQKK